MEGSRGQRRRQGTFASARYPSNQSSVIRRHGALSCPSLPQFLQASIYTYRFNAADLAISFDRCTFQTESPMRNDTFFCFVALYSCHPFSYALCELPLPVMCASGGKTTFIALTKPIYARKNTSPVRRACELVIRPESSSRNLISTSDFCFYSIRVIFRPQTLRF